MTKRWVFKIDTPWGRKGDELTHSFRSIMVTDTEIINYPDLFELVEEKSDEERLAGWLYDERMRWNGLQPWEEYISKKCAKLIAAGVDVKKLVDKE